MALVGSSFMPKTMLHLPSSNSYPQKKPMTIRSGQRKGKKMTEGSGVKINSVLRISRRIEVSISEENVPPLGFNAVEENMDSKRDEASALETGASDNYFGRVNFM